MTLKNKSFQKGLKEIPPPSGKGLGMGFPPFLWKGRQTPKSLPGSSRVR